MIENEPVPQPLAEIEVGPSKMDQFLDKNQKKLIWLSILILCLGAGIIVYKSIAADRENTAGAQLIAAYDSKTNKYNPEMIEALMAQYPGTAAAKTAGYLHTVALWDAGRQEECIAALNKMLELYPHGPLRDEAALVLGCRRLQSGEVDKAVEVFQLVVDSENPVFSPIALINLGDIARDKGETDKAKAYYEEAQSKYPDSSFTYIQNQDPRNQNPMSQVMMKSPAQARLELLGIKKPEQKAAPMDLTIPKFGDEEKK